MSWPPRRPGWSEVPFAKGHAKTPLANFPIGPEVLYRAPTHVQSLWKAKEIFITENGCAGEPALAEDGRVYDTDRIMVVRAFLTRRPMVCRPKAISTGARWTTSSGRQGSAIATGDRVRRLQGAESHTQDERIVVPRGTQRDDVKRGACACASNVSMRFNTRTLAVFRRSSSIILN